MRTTLLNKAVPQFNYLSRYIGVPTYYHPTDNKYFQGTTTYLDNATTYTNYTVARGDTLDSLALKFYNNPTYFWILCSFNHIQDPYTQLEEGSIIKIPSFSDIKFLDY